MNRRVSPALRVGRALTALLTVWCLGCSGYEPLADALLGSGAASGMACASMPGMTGEQSASEGSGVSQGEPSVTAPASHRGFDCGCGQSCQATSLSGFSIALRAGPLPAIPAADVTQPPSVVRAPLLPPPERMTA